jgi:hypothetical protein
MAEDIRFVIPEPPFAADSNSLLYALLMGGISAGIETLAVTQGANAVLTPPAGAKYAFIQVESNSGSADLQKTIVYTQDGTSPNGTSTPKIGIIQSDGGALEIKGSTNLANFKVRSIENLTHYLHIEYFK